ncbi:MAG: 4Fe-4S dicluster domain-containing protein [Candidatus Dadabacteria bacterium]|nr:MAG: 4Fe-4S dicluster domain-containing protein [Candidatus Dadabacteria bacterium]
MSGEGTNGVSRRKFLKIVGQGSALATLAGCGKSSVQKIVPYVKGNSLRIVGSPLWFKTTCNECSAGCGIMVKTREGRAIKIEGNPEHPVNKGGVCARGHSALQDLYDPDRVRQPLYREGKGAAFKAVSWTKALSILQEKIGTARAKAYLGREGTGALRKLLSTWCKAVGARQVVYTPNPFDKEAESARLVFGYYGIPNYRLDRADVVVNFGADFLESWISPVEYSRKWAKSRKRKPPCRYIHFEPRLSLTAAKADRWISIAPGAEIMVVRLLIKEAIASGRGRGLKGSALKAATKLSASVDYSSVSTATGIDKSILKKVSERLLSAKAPLVLAGGTPARSEDPLGLLVAVNLLNLALGAVGSTVELSSLRVAERSSLSDVTHLIEEMSKGSLDLLFIDDSDPVFNLPSDFGIKEALKAVPFVVSFSSHLDDTTSFADMVLPSHTPLESFGDSAPVEGVYCLSQPVMKPVFDTRHFGDILLDTARLLGKEISRGTFASYLKDSWKAIYKKYGDSSQPFERFWLESVERGGFFAPTSRQRTVKPSKGLSGIKFSLPQFSAREGGDVVVYPFATVRSSEGRFANRPWLTEVPDPLSQVSWDAWAEIHPETAAKNGLSEGDRVTIRNYFGELNLNVYITPYVHKGIVAVPIGYGHRRYGRFAENIGGNVKELLDSSKAKKACLSALLTTKASLIRSRVAGDLVKLQGSDSQLGRGLARTSYVEEDAFHHASDVRIKESGFSHHDNHGKEHEKPKEMYEQREHPLYKWAMTIDLASCTGCSACIVSCFAENNISVVGKRLVSQGREMAWLRIDRYFDGDEENPQVSMMPMMCQQCDNAPCEPVCPVYATYHNEEGLNVMVYNRCVGTRYCSNNCTYKVRHYNWAEVVFPEPLNWQLNPDVTPRSVGVMEKCTFCVQRIVEAKDRAKDQGRKVKDGEVQPACMQSCPTKAITFGDINDKDSQVAKLSKDKRAYKVLDHYVNTKPSVTYLENIKYKEV